MQKYIKFNLLLCSVVDVAANRHPIISEYKKTLSFILIHRKIHLDNNNLLYKNPEIHKYHNVIFSVCICYEVAAMIIHSFGVFDY